MLSTQYRMKEHATPSEHHSIQCQWHPHDGHHCITIQLNTSEIAQIRTSSVSSKLEDPDK